LIEPNAPSRRSLVEALEARRYAVSGVSSGADGLGLLHGGFVPCLIIYILSDGDDSQGFLSARLAAPGFSKLPIVLYSGEEIREASIADGVLPDPLLGALLTLVGRHCPTRDYGH
jgi:hypothetical protein